MVGVVGSNPIMSTKLPVQQKPGAFVAFLYLTDSFDKRPSERGGAHFGYWSI